MIHGDIHDQNLLCQLVDGEWSINAVLDLGDSHYSAYVIELALATAYMILQSGLVESGTHVIAGYCSVLPLPLDELRLLKVKWLQGNSGGGNQKFQISQPKPKLKIQS